MKKSRDHMKKSIVCRGRCSRIRFDRNTRVGTSQRHHHRHHRSPPRDPRRRLAFPNAMRSNSWRRRSAACRSRSSCLTMAVIRPMPPPTRGASSPNPRPTSSWVPRRRRPRSRCLTSPTRRAFRISVSRRSRSRRNAQNGRCRCRSRSRSWARCCTQHMKAHNVKTVGFIGYSDSYGDLWFNDFKNQAEPMGMNMVDEERFARPDTSVTGQVLKLVAANPDAILIGASGTAAALPQTDIARSWLQGPDLPDPWRRQHGLYPYCRKSGGGRDHGIWSGHGS